MSKHIELLAFEDTNRAKEIIANWLLYRCNDQLDEIIYLLDKAYPEGAEERLHNDWVEVIVEEEQRWDGVKNVGSLKGSS